MQTLFSHRFTFTAPPPRVFSALTSGPELQAWFAEHAEGASAAGAPYRFWGRHTLAQPSRADATQAVTRFEPNRLLAYSWRIGPAASEVTMELEPAEGGTALKLSHALSAEPSPRRGRELIEDHWRLAMGNLMAHLAGGDGIVLPDYGNPAPVVRFERFINAPPAVVFRTLTEPALINQWFDTDKSIVELRVGGRYETGWEYEVDGKKVRGGPTTILELVPGKRLVLDWPDWRGDTSVTGQTITFELAAEGAGTRLTFVHAGFERQADVGDYPFGWGHFIAQLSTVAERGS